MGTGCGIALGIVEVLWTGKNAGPRLNRALSVAVIPPWLVLAVGVDVPDFRCVYLCGVWSRYFASRMCHRPPTPVSWLLLMWKRIVVGDRSVVKYAQKRHRTPVNPCSRRSTKNSHA